MTLIGILIGVIIAPIVLLVTIIKAIIKKSKENKQRALEAEYRQLESEALRKMGLSSWDAIPYFDDYVPVKSRQTLDKYDDIKFFKENKGKLAEAEAALRRKSRMVLILRKFIVSLCGSFFSNKLMLITITFNLECYEKSINT